MNTYDVQRVIEGAMTPHIRTKSIQPEKKILVFFISL